MERRKLGGIGLGVSLIGLATEHLEQTRETMESVLRMAVDAGVKYVGLLYDDPDGVPAFWDDLAPALQACRERLILAHWGKGPGRAGDLDGAQRCVQPMLPRCARRKRVVPAIGLLMMLPLSTQTEKEACSET